MEAGYCWQPLYDRLEEIRYDVKLTHPLKAKAIAQAKVKTDKIDSEILTHLLRTWLFARAIEKGEIKVIAKEVMNRSKLRDVVVYKKFEAVFKT